VSRLELLGFGVLYNTQQPFCLAGLFGLYWNT